MSEVLYRATKYMNVEDALLAKEDKPKKGRDLKMHARTKGGRNQGRETDAMKGVPSPQGEGLQALLP